MCFAYEDSDVPSMDFEQEQRLLDGSSQKPEAVVEVQATSPHHVNGRCAPEEDILPLSTVQGLQALCSSDKNTTELGSLNDNVDATANVTESGAPRTV